MKKVIIASLWFLTVIAAFAIGFLVAYPTAQIGNLEEEYNTADIIRAVQDFVVEHERWPASWRELGRDAKSSKYTTVNWQINLSTAEQYDILQAIQPKTGFYLTYPHAEKELEKLFLTVLMIRQKKLLAVKAETPSGGWTLALEHSEMPPNSGAGASVTRTMFSVFQSGFFKVEQTVHNTSGQLTRRERREGTLTAAQIAEIEGNLAAADLESFPESPIELAGGSGTEDGWGGAVSLIESGKTSHVRYTSGGGYPNDPEAQERLKRFSTLLGQLKALAFEELKKIRF